MPAIRDFLGRTDDQVKIRGYRVEPGEVASVIMSHPGVASAAVVADQSSDGPGGGRTVGGGRDVVGSGVAGGDRTV